MNPYEVLECSPDADQATLRDAYRRLVRLHHPDLAPDDEQRDLAHDQMQRINQAWQMIGDPQKRAAYDAANKPSEVRPTPVQPRPRTPKEPLRPRTKANSKLKIGKSALPKASKANTPKIVPISPTRRKVQKLKQVRSPEEVRLRNQQRLADADFLRREGRIAEAISVCQSVLRSDFRSVIAREMLGDIYIGLGDASKALILFEQALALQENNINLKRKVAEVRAMLPKSEPPTPKSEAPKVTPVASPAPAPKPATKTTPKPAAEPSLFFREESFQVGANEPLQDGSFWRRLRGKLGNRR